MDLDMVVMVIILVLVVMVVMVVVVVMQSNDSVRQRANSRVELSLYFGETGS
jgi:flagellar basal body-associated protein FliL